MITRQEPALEFVLLQITTSWPTLDFWAKGLRVYSLTSQYWSSVYMCGGEAGVRDEGQEPGGGQAGGQAGGAGQDCAPAQPEQPGRGQCAATGA